MATRPSAVEDVIVRITNGVRARPAPLRAIGVLALAIALLLVFAACGGDDDSSTSDPASSGGVDPNEVSIGAGEPIVIGVSTALTGPVGERGTEYRDAVLVGVESWRAANGDTILDHAIEVHSEDDGCTEADQTAVAAERLLRDARLAGVIGPQCSAGAAAVIPTYREARVVTISGSATATALTIDQGSDGYFFRTAFRNDLQGSVVGDFVAETLGARTVFLVDDGETYGQDLAASTQRFLEENGISVRRATAPQRTVDFSELAGVVVSAAPDAVGYAGFNPDAALFYRQLRDAGYDGAFGSFDAAASASEFIAPLGEVAEGVYFAGCALTPSAEFHDAFVAIHGGEPAAAFNGQYADAVRVLLDAVAATAEARPDGSLTIDREALRDAVRVTSIPAGHTGALRFDLNGDRASDRAAPGDQANDFGLIGCRVQGAELVQIQGQ